MRNSQKGVVEFLVILAVAVVGLFLVGYNLYKSGKILTYFNPQMTTVLKETHPDVKDWQIFTDKDCGKLLKKVPFSINYPEGWTVETTDSDGWSSYKFVSENTGEMFELLCGDGFGGGCEPQHKNKFTIANQRVEGCLNKDSKGNQHLWSTYIQPTDNVNFSFSGIVRSTDTLEQILSTFHFLDPNMEGWSIYTNDKHNYNLYFPPEWYLSPENIEAEYGVTSIANLDFADPSYDDPKNIPGSATKLEIQVVEVKKAEQEIFLNGRTSGYKGSSFFSDVNHIENSATKIGNLPTQQIILTSSSDNSETREYLAFAGDKILIISHHDSENEIETVRKILSSFKFLY